MPRFLIFKLDGPMQAWGTHTYEAFRPSSLFPTRSGLLGLIAACLGLEREDLHGLERLAGSIEFTVRVDRSAPRLERADSDGAAWPDPKKPAIKLRDFHTVLFARKVDGSRNEYPIVSRREYLYDAAFTVAAGEHPGAPVSLTAIAEGLRRPRYTPVLGRRSCPLARPLFASWQEGPDAKAALDAVPPSSGLIYAEGEGLTSPRLMHIRDVPMHGRQRKFATRRVYVHGAKED
jgi:CRISPR system Cascade subunit CasD